MAILLATNFTSDALAQWGTLLRHMMPDETFVTNRDLYEPGSIDIAFVANPPPGALQGLQNLRLIQSMWAGMDKLLRDPSVPSDVPLARMVDPAMSAAMAETALWAVLSLHRGFFVYAAQQRLHRWKTHEQLGADEISVAVLGLGQMGRSVALKLAASGYDVIGWSARESALPSVRTFSGDAALPGVLGQAQIAINLLPLTPATHGLFDQRSFEQMPVGASFVNLARGGHVVEADLIAALDNGHLRHAVLDVFETEPLPSRHPFWGHAKVTVLPHVAAQTDLRTASLVAADNVRAVREGRVPAHLVDRRRGY